MAYRSGGLRVHDPAAGPMEVTGDGYAAAGELVTLAVDPDVQRFLGMSDDEIAAASVIDRRYRETLRRVYSGGGWRPPHLHPPAQPARREVHRALTRLLGSERTARLQRLSWRIRGGDALLDDDVADALHLTPQQRRRLVAASEENEREYARVIAEVGQVRHRGADRLGDPSAYLDRARRADSAGSERLVALLAPEQAEAFVRLRTEQG